MLGSVFNRKYNIVREIEQLQEDIRAIDDLRETVATQGWIRLRELMADKVVAYDTSIVVLSANPQKNADEIKAKHALRTVLKEIVFAVDNTFRMEKEVRDKLKVREEVAKNAGSL